MPRTKKTAKTEKVVKLRKKLKLPYIIQSERLEQFKKLDAAFDAAMEELKTKESELEKAKKKAHGEFWKGIYGIVGTDLSKQSVTLNTDYREQGFIVVEKDESMTLGDLLGKAAKK